MKIFTENEPFEKGYYTIVGVVFCEPRSKRKSYRTEKCPGIVHWQLDLFISAKHRINVELVESCTSQMTNLKKWGTNGNGAVAVLNAVEMWSEMDGLMDSLSHEIMIINPIGRIANAVLDGTWVGEFHDDSLSTNPCTEILNCPIGMKKIKQAIRLARYYRRISAMISSKDEPQNCLEKAVFEHFRIDPPKLPKLDHSHIYNYVQPGQQNGKKQIVIGVGVKCIDDCVNIMISGKNDDESEIVQVSIAKLGLDSRKTLEDAIGHRLIILVQEVTKVGQIFEFDEKRRNCLTIFDSTNLNETETKYSSYLAVRLLIIYIHYIVV